MKSISKITLLSILAFLVTPVFSQKQAYELYNQRGRAIRYERMLNDCKRANVILFGEQHNNAIAHWLQFELTKDLYGLLGDDLVLGAEMFEADGQLILDEYFSGLITQKKFEDEMRLWNNYKTDYKPLIEFAKEQDLLFVATNIPRRYASLVFNLGLDSLQSLSDEAKRYMMPLPLEYDTSLTAYSSLMAQNPMGMHGNPENFRDAQAVKDATMAWFILNNFGRGETFLHFNGSYHSDNFESINYFLKRSVTDLEIVTITTVSQEDVSKLDPEHEDKANYIIAVPEAMTKTY